MGQKVLVTPRSLTEAPHPAVEAMRDRGLDVVYATPGRLPDEVELLRLVPDVNRMAGRRRAGIAESDRCGDAAQGRQPQRHGPRQPAARRTQVPRHRGADGGWRQCVAIGCSGYQEFKLRLAHSLALGTTATHSVLSKDDSTAELVEKIFGYTMTSLDWARSHLDTEALGQAIALLSEARSIEFFGLGASGIVALDAQQKFPLFGVPCGAQADTHQQLMTASMMQPGDVAVIFSNTGHTIAMIEVAEVAQENGAGVIGVSGSRSPLLDHCDVAILVETLDNTDIYTPTISRIAALVVVDILCSAVGLRRDAEHGQRFENMKQLLRSQRVNGPRVT